MKKILAWILILSCLMSLLPLTALATEQETKTKGGKLIALTFDDGPSSYTKSLLDGLAERNAKATFFMLGQCASYYPSTVRRVFNEGHEIAQHTYDHPALTTQSNDQILWQVQHTDEILDSCLGMDLDYLLRPPYGDCSSRVLSQIGCPAIMWSVDSVDWQSLNAYSVRNTIVNNAFDGAIILVHDIHSTSIPGALMAIDILQAEGYEFVTVSELYRRRGVELADGGKYYSCKPTGTDLGEITPPVIETSAIYGGYEVTMKAQEGTTIYYSTDGSVPNKAYTGPITVNSNTTFQAFACYELNRGRSETINAAIKVERLAVPSIYAENGCYYFEQYDEDVDIRYIKGDYISDEENEIYSEGIPWYRGSLSCFAAGEGIRSPVTTYYLSENGNAFKDVGTDCWYFDAMDRAVSLGLLNGIGNYHYAPESELTRAAFVTMLHRMLAQAGYDVSATGQADFPDFDEASWYAEAVSWAYEKGIIFGYPDATVRPDASITREEMCVILDRLLSHLELEIEAAEPDFADGELISDWAEDAVGRMVKAGIIQGDNNHCFNPSNTASRAEAVTVLLRLYDLPTSETRQPVEYRGLFRI